MKNTLFTLFVSIILFSCSREGIQGLGEQEVLNYENGVIATGTVSTTGLQAPAGTVFSEIKPSLLVGVPCFYLNFQELARYSVSDDFKIPANEIWDVEKFSFYLINPMSSNTATNFPVKNLVLEIYDGDPSIATSKKVYGDLETNLFESAAPTNIYSISTETTDMADENTVNKVYKVQAKINTPLNLKGGTYWYKMTLKFDYGQDWNCYTIRLPQKGNTESAFNAYYQHFKTGEIFKTDNGSYNGDGTQPVNYEIPFQITGTKSVN